MEPRRHAEPPRVRTLIRVRLLLALLLARGIASAHTGSNSYADISLEEREVSIALQISYADWLPIVDLDADHDGRLMRDEIIAQLPRLGAYVRSRVRVIADGRPCEGDAVDAGTGGTFDAMLTLIRMVYRCPAPLRVVTITSALFAREHPGHRTFAVVRDAISPTDVRQHVFGQGSETLELALDWRTKNPARAGIEFLRLGVLAILTRAEALLVLVGLLLAAAATRDVILIGAAFAVSSVIALTIGALGLVPLDRVPVAEALVVSIVVVGLVNLLAPRHAGRWPLGFVCGLVHGLGFARLFVELRVAPAALGATLAAFAAGVAIGLLVAVCLAYPPVAWLHARPWGARATRGMSAAIALAGVYLWCVRALLSG